MEEPGSSRSRSGPTVSPSRHMKIDLAKTRASSRATFAIRLDTLIDRFRARKIRASYVESLAIIWPQWDEDHSEIQNGSLFPSTRKDSIASLADSSRTLLLGRLPTLPRCRSVRLEASHPDAAQILISLLHHTPALTDLRCKLKEGRKRPDYRLPALPLERPPLPHLRRLDLGMSTREYVDLLRLLLKEQSHTLDTLSVWAREQAGRDRIKEIREALLAADLSRTTVLGTFAGTWPPSASLPALEVAEVHMTVKASRPFLEEIVRLCRYCRALILTGGQHSCSRTSAARGTVGCEKL